MQAVFEQLEAVSPILPPLVRVMILVVAFVLAWLILSVPGYWLEQALSPWLLRFSSALALTRASALDSASALFGARKKAVDQFVTEHAQVFSLAEENDQFVKSLGALKQSVAAIPENAVSLERELVSAEKQAAESALLLQRIGWPEPIKAPTAQDYSGIRVVRNDAALRVVTFVIFSAFLIAINTLMLKEFFAAVAPPVKVLGIPLSIVLSFLFSVLEICFGACLAFVEGPAYSLGRLLILSALCLLGAVEFGFYAQFGADINFDPFSSLWGADKPPAWTKSWLGIFGPLVVLGMGYAGDRLFNALRILFRDSVVRQYREYLNMIVRRADEFRTRMEDAHSASFRLSDVLKGVTARFLPLAQGIPDSIKQLNEIRTEMDDTLRQALETRLAPFSEIGRAEMLRSFYGYLFMVPTSVIAFFLIALAFGALGYSEPIKVGSTALPSFAVAIGQTLISIAVGFATGRTVNGSSGEDLSRSISIGSKIALWAAYAAGIAMIGADGLAFYHRGGGTVDHMWFALTNASILSLFIVGRRLGVILAAAWASIQAIVTVAGSGLMLFAAFILLVVVSIVYILMMIVQIVAFPLHYFFRREAIAPSAVKRAAATFFILGVVQTLPFDRTQAQQLSVEPQSSVSVLIDLSSTWHYPERKALNAQLLRTVGEAAVGLALDVDPPVIVRYLAIGDMSLGRTPLCEVVFAPKLLQKPGEQNELGNVKLLRSYLQKTCVDFVLGRKQEKFTDLSAAFDNAGRYIDQQAGAFKGIIVLSDFKEERRSNQIPSTIRLPGTSALLMYRVLEEDRIDSSKLDQRVSAWREILKKAGAKVAVINDAAASPGQIHRLLNQ